MVIRTQKGLREKGHETLEPRLFALLQKNPPKIWNFQVQFRFGPIIDKIYCGHRQPSDAKSRFELSRAIPEFRFFGQLNSGEKFRTWRKIEKNETKVVFSGLKIVPLGKTIFTFFDFFLFRSKVFWIFVKKIRRQGFGKNRNEDFDSSPWVSTNAVRLNDCCCCCSCCRYCCSCCWCCCCSCCCCCFCCCCCWTCLASK